MRLRSAQISDAEAVAAIWRASIRITCAPAYGFNKELLHSWADSKTPEKTALLIRSEEFFMVAEDSAGICGFFCATFALGTFALFVKPACQRQGVGTRLFRCCLRLFAVQTGKTFFCFHSSLNAVPFYQRQGAVIAGEPVLEPYPCIPMKISTKIG